MSKFGLMVMGPAGAGKTTFCRSLITHLQNTRRSHYWINLDPAADNTPSSSSEGGSSSVGPDLDIRDLITLEDVMEELELGPNGGLMYCLEFLLENSEFLTEAIESDVDESTLIIIDMPGQIELFTHVPLVPELLRRLSDVRLCATWLMEATYVVDKPKFFAASLAAMSAMLLLECPHVNVLSKCDLVKGVVSKRELRRFARVEPGLIHDREPEEEENEMLRLPPQTANDRGEEADDPGQVMSGKSFTRLNQAVAGLLDDFSMLSFLQLDLQNEDSLGAVLSYVDDAIQYHEAQEPREPVETEYDMGENEA